ncbi:thermonuclease family protein [Thermincola potens]|uniref:Nuclease (SNase domain protein) n=1 Tax=Thermincola potens (strain JR) TaxID=635013 RepID=D5XES8_THEPJ|nr:thermonuclease family protein [Thermincola potens]ADG82149.1 nuclease (SNase domain protein) [Thermincola potens JR]
MKRLNRSFRRYILYIVVFLALIWAESLVHPRIAPKVDPNSGKPSNTAGINKYDEKNRSLYRLPQTKGKIRDFTSEQGNGEQIRLIPGTVTRTVDGDTVYVRLVSGDEEKVRLTGVNTPEIHHPQKGVEPYGREAADYTRSHLSGKKVYLETDINERDKYGRLLAYVWMARPSSTTDSEIRAKMFNARLLLDGYGQLMTVPPNVKYADYFQNYQREARENNLGLWGIKGTF